MKTLLKCYLFACFHLSSLNLTSPFAAAAVAAAIELDNDNDDDDDDDTSSFTKSNICSKISCGVVTCHLANVRLLLCATAVVKIASGWIDNGTTGHSFPGERRVIAIGGAMTMFSPGGKRSARNISSSVYVEND